MGFWIQNSILLKLNKIRHFTYTKDSNEFEHKINKLIGRSAITEKHKKRMKKDGMNRKGRIENNLKPNKFFGT